MTSGRTRRGRIALAVVLITVLADLRSPAAWAACSTHHAVDPLTNGYVTSVVCAGRPPGRPRRPKGGPSHLKPRVRRDKHVDACVDAVTAPGPPEPGLSDLQVLDATLAVVRPCHGAALGPPRPGTLGSEFWARTALPRPAPVISPAEPITGRDAYLMLETALTQSVTQATPLGPLTVAAEGRASVDWGDGSTTTGRLGDAGGPYPDGHIRHVYERRGPVDIDVAITWRATWSLAGQLGRLPQLTTTSKLPATVREVQAVITG